MSKRGKLVKTEKGKKGIIYNDDPAFNEKYKVHIVDENFQPTGEKLLCSPEKLELIGYTD